MSKLFTLEPFTLTHNLIGLAGGESAARLPFQIPPRSGEALDRVMGIVDTTDDASVHAEFWERHPTGDEVLCVLTGRLRATVSLADQSVISVDIAPGQAFIVPRARWHRLQVVEPGRLLFCTPAADGQTHRHGSTPLPESPAEVGDSLADATRREASHE